MSVTAVRAYVHAAVVIPAHNDRTRLRLCLRSVLTAALATPIPVTIVVVLEDTENGGRELAGQFGSDVHFISFDAGNMGAARAAGFGYVRTLRDHLGKDGAQCWYATTDADSRVDPGWLVRQMGLGVDVVLGVVRVDDWDDHCGWDDHCDDGANLYVQEYEDRPYEYIHGANMGFSARAYWQVGGFRALASGENAALVAQFDAAGYCVRRDTGSSVATSARTVARAPHGFADHLRVLDGRRGGSAMEGCA